MENLTITSLNVRGLRNKSKRKRIFKNFREKKYDVICIQESYITKNVSSQWKQEWGGDMVYCEGTNHGRGQLILIRKQFPYEWSLEIERDRLLSIKIKADNKEISVFNVYAPCATRETKDFFSYVKEAVNECESDFKIVCGDFNAVLNNNLDIISGEKHSVSLVESFGSLIEECGLNDIWRIFNGDSKEYTWSRQSGNQFIARRLDYVLLNDGAMSEAFETNIFSVPSSDHRGIYINLRISDNNRGPGYFKFNNSLLQDKIFVQKMNAVIDNFLTQNANETPVQKWELLKLKLKNESMQYSKSLAVKRRNNSIILHNKLDTCEAALALDPNNKDLQRKCHNLKLEIEVFERNRLKSAQVRARVKWIEEGEKNSKYFLNLEKTRAKQKLFPSIELENGNVVANQFDILNAQKEYYENLYSGHVNEQLLEDAADTFLDRCDIPELTEEEKQICEGNITRAEASIALKSMKNGSAPGSDGMTTEFLKCFWIKVRDVVVQSFNESFANGSLSYSQTSAVITLLHKGKDLPKNKLANWRPISLTNSDYKLLAKCLANRLSKVINTLVCEDQVGYIKGRQVSTTLRTIDDVIEYYKLKEKPGILLALDFRKAFDSISKRYMLYAFKKFGFGNDFIHWVRVLFTDTRSCMIYNGWLSEDFEVKSGIRQGCPFSPLAFIMGVELLAIRIRQSDNLKGLDLSAEKVLRVLLYADDITAFLKDRNDVGILLKILEEFSLFSGLYLNKQKTEALGIGSNRNVNFGCGIKWVKQIKILGIYFDNTKCASELDLNWNCRIANIKQQILSWERRNLGLLGKICVIKSMLLSQFIHIMQAICIPQKVLKEINTILYRFLWRKKDCNRKAFEKVKRVVVNSDIDKGGINMVDVEIMQESFLCQWLKKFSMSNGNAKWTWIPDIIIGAFGRNCACFSTTIGSATFKGLSAVKSVFWKSVICTWLKYNKCSNLESTKMACLWNNPDITYHNSVVYFQNWAKEGFTYVHDLLQDNVILNFPSIEAVLGPSPSLYLEYLVVYSAVSAYLRNKPTYVSDPVNTFELMFNGEKTTTAKAFRKYIVESKYSIPCAVQFWKNKFNVDISTQHWTNIFKATRESRLRELHWKIVHNIYPTNILLKKMGIANNELCSLCKVEIDFIEHFFFKCPKIKHLWTHVENTMNTKWGTNVVLNVNAVLLGVEDKNMLDLNNLQQKYINQLILVGKMCISKYRYGTPINIVMMFDSEVRLRNLS